MRHRCALLCASLLAAGCYSYVPTTLEQVSPGESLRIRISGTEAERLEPLRFTDSRNLEGSLAQIAGDGVYFDAIIRTVTPTGITAMHTQRLNIPLSEIQDVQYRRLDVLKTGAAVGGLAFALGTAAYFILFRDLGSTDEYEPPTDMTFGLRIPLGLRR
jgi:hypothetical protein